MLFSEEKDSVQEKLSYPKGLWRDQLIGQDQLLIQISIILEAKQFPHCSIVSGLAGNEQLLVGLHIAQSLLCISEDKPCGVCSGCYKSNKLIHPDLHFSFPVVGAAEEAVNHYEQFREAVQKNPYLNVQDWLVNSENENKQANISVKEARSIVDRLYFKPFEANCTVLILWLPEYLGKESNILLKLLEEPPGNAFIIMVTEDINSILSTVKSRAQEFRLKPVTEELLSEFLIKTKGINKSKAKEFAIASEGNISSCLNWLEEENVKFLELIRQMFQKAYLQDPQGYLEWIEQVAELKKDEQKQLFSFLTSILSLCIRAKADSLEHTADVEIWNYATKISSKLSIEAIENIADLADDCSFGIQRNANLRILLLDYLIKLSTFIR
ncbi:MAG: hypothetical protein ABI851_05645 [Saprospiraceae bacterium]